MQSNQHDNNTMTASVRVYPIPARDVINITLGEEMVSAKTIINIINSGGKVMATENSSGARSVQLNVASLAPGYYVVQVTSDKKTITKSITIVR